MKKKAIKRTNLIFFCMILFYFFSSLVLSVISSRVEISTITTLIFGELIILLPGLIFALLYKMPVSEWFPVRKIKVSTIFFTILLAFLLMPLLYFINILSQLFENNVAIDLFADIYDIPYLLIFLIVGIFGPFCEELAFRGFIFGGFKKSGRILAAAILSAILFGLFHMNLNQIGYATLIGFASAMLLEGTGSIIPSMILHITVNSYNVFQMMISDKLLSFYGNDFSDIVAASDNVSADYLLRFAGALIAPAVIATALAVVVYITIIKKEGTKDHIVSIMSKKTEPSPESGKKPHLLSAFGIIGIMICLIATFLGEYLKSFF